MPPVITEMAWKAVRAHDPRFDGTFVYAVSTTGVYCRPSCPSRRPHRRHVEFFHSPALAEAAGFRACRRCEPHSRYRSRGEKIVEEMRRHLDEHPDEPVTLRALAVRAGMSVSHLQRVFTRTIGVSPKVYWNAARLDRFRKALRRRSTATEATYEAGFAASSRASEQSSLYLAMTPSAFRAGAAGVTLRYATLRTRLGLVQIAATDRGVASVMLGDNEARLLTRLRHEYPNAIIRHDSTILARHRRALRRYFEGKASAEDVRLDVSSTAFQVKVWRALQQIPFGSRATYREIATMIGRPSASRAVGRACAENPVALFIPCHRVLREDGRLAGYRWGLRRKRALLRLEAKTACREPISR